MSLVVKSIYLTSRYSIQRACRMFSKCRRGVGFSIGLIQSPSASLGFGSRHERVATNAANPNFISSPPESPATTEQREEALQRGNRGTKDNVKLSNDTKQTAEQQRR